MLITALLAIVTAFVARARGGSVESLAETNFRWLPYLWVGLGIQVAYSVLPLEGLSKGRAVLVLLLSYVMVAAFLISNRKLPGMWLATAGMAMNIVVIAANGAMPVSVWAAEQIGAHEADFERGGVKHEEMTDDTLVPFLGDIIPVPGLGEVISVGDVILAAGISQLVYVQMTRSKTRTGRADDPDPTPL